MPASPRSPGLADLLDSLPVGIYRTTPDGRILEANLALVRLLGCADREELLSTSAEAFYADADVRRRATGTLAAGGQLVDFEAEMRVGDGRRLVRMNTRAVRDADGAPLWFDGTMEDITEARAAAQALRESEERYRTYLALSTEGIWRSELDEPCDPAWPVDRQVAHIRRHGWIAECNDAMARMYGLTSGAQMVGARLRDMLVEDDPRNDAYLAAFIEGGYRIEDAESVETDAAGATHIIRNSFVGIVENGMLVRAWGTQRDITSQRRAETALQDSEARLRQAQKMEAVGRLAGGVAHDFNNLLTAILGYATMMEHDALTDVTPLDAAREIRLAAERAAALTRQLLAFSRQQVLQPEVLDINAVIEDTVPMLGRLIGEDIRLVTRLATGLRAVRADRGQLQQVILNLVLNARDAMPGGGQVLIATAAGAADDAPRLPAGGAAIRLTVADTGVGMSPAVQARVFEPYFTTKSVGKGTGLGLATVYGIMEQSGGAIAVDSTEGRGTSFVVALPASDGRPAAAAGPAPEAVAGSETVLVVEDEPAVRTFIVRALRNRGYDVLEAADGADALAIARRTAGSIGLLVSDVVMPGLGGGEVAAALTGERPGLKVLFLSGYAGDDVARRDLAVRGSAFLQKPFDAGALAAAVRQVLDGA